jgi:diadenosine tetraphosphate (Ap4A) HIT family hydrolase/acetyltransferase-like isoleucine patch superfamily enzyme
MKNGLECPFCNLSLNDRKLIESESSIAVLAKHAVNDAQALVIPKRHFTDIAEIPAIELSDLINLAKRTISLFKKIGVADDFNLIANNGVLAGQSIEHFHFHIIPRKEGDCPEPKYWLSEHLFKMLREIPMTELVENAGLLRQKMADFSGNIASTCSDELWLNIAPSCVIEAGVVFGNTNYKDKETDKSIFVGNNAIIRSGTVMYHNTKAGCNFDCGHNVLIREGSRIGDNVYVYSGTQINRDVIIGDNCIVSGYLGNGSVVESSVKMFGDLIHKHKDRYSSVHEPAPVIKSGAFVGWGAKVIGGVVIGENATIGAGAVVIGDVPPETTVVGVPAKPIKPTSP